MNQSAQVFLFVGVVGLSTLGMATYLTAQHLIDGGVFNTLAGALIGGAIGLLAPSPAFKTQGPNPPVVP